MRISFRLNLIVPAFFILFLFLSESQGEGEGFNNDDKASPPDHSPTSSLSPQLTFNGLVNDNQKAADDRINNYYHRYGVTPDFIWENKLFKDWPDIIWMAPFFSGGGYCSEAISFILSLDKYLGVINKLFIQQHGDSFSNNFINGLNPKEKKILFSRQLSNRKTTKKSKKSMGSLKGSPSPSPSPSPIHSIEICHSEPGAWNFPQKYQTTLCPSSQTKEHHTITIGRTMFETDRLPSGWEERLNKMDYVWVPTEFHREVFASGGVRKEKIIVIPEPVDTDFFDPKNAKPFIFPSDLRQNEKTNDEQVNKIHAGDQPLISKPFRFLSIFKFEDRKGWEILLEAYYREFRLDKDFVELNILTSAYHSDSDFERHIQTFKQSLNFNEDEATKLPSVHIIPQGIPNTKMPDLYSSSDCFVLPSRGEGWGRPHVEAMSMGLPIIATYWSGTTEYMTHNNSYPLNITGLESIKKGPFKGHKWASPSLDHLRYLMRHVYSNPEEIKSKGLQARNDMIQFYSQDRLADILLTQLNRIIRQHSNIPHDEL